jgi:hypothetical protein
VDEYDDEERNAIRALRQANKSKDRQVRELKAQLAETQNRLASEHVFGQTTDELAEEAVLAATDAAERARANLGLSRELWRHGSLRRGSALPARENRAV